MNKSVQQIFNLFQQVYMQSSMAINIEFHLNRLEFFITHTHTCIVCVSFLLGRRPIPKLLCWLQMECYICGPLLLQMGNSFFFSSLACDNVEQALCHYFRSFNYLSCLNYFRQPEVNTRYCRLSDMESI